MSLCFGDMSSLWLTRNIDLERGEGELTQTNRDYWGPFKGCYGSDGASRGPSRPCEGARTPLLEARWEHWKLAAGRLFPSSPCV